MRSRSPANSADSAPPSPALISRMTSLSSSGSLRQQLLAQPAGELLDLRLQRVASAANDASSPASSRAVPRSPRASSSARAVSTSGASCGVPAAQPPGAGLVGVHGRVGELALQGGVLVEQAPTAGRAALIGGLLSDGLTADMTTAPVPPRERGGTGAVGGATCRRARNRPGRACRTASRSGRRGHRCPGSSACRCRTGGRPSRPRRSADRSGTCCASVNVLPQPQVTVVTLYAGWMSGFISPLLRKSLSFWWWNAGGRRLFRPRQRGSVDQSPRSLRPADRTGVSPSRPGPASSSGSA